MVPIKIYLAHALSNAPEEFHVRMRALKERIRSLTGVQILDFAWAKGQAFNQDVNVYEYDMKQVEAADFIVFILDELSFGLAMELQKRCMIKRPFLALVKAGQKVSKIVPDCMKFHGDSNHYSLMEYRSEAQLFGYIQAFIVTLQSNESIQELTELINLQENEPTSIAAR